MINKEASTDGLYWECIKSAWARTVHTFWEGKPTVVVTLVGTLALITWILTRKYTDQSITPKELWETFGIGIAAYAAACILVFVAYLWTAPYRAWADKNYHCDLAIDHLTAQRQKLEGEIEALKANRKERSRKALLGLNSAIKTAHDILGATPGKPCEDASDKWLKINVGQWYNEMAMEAINQSASGSIEWFHQIGLPLSAMTDEASAHRVILTRLDYLITLQEQETLIAQFG